MLPIFTQGQMKQINLRLEGDYHYRAADVTEAFGQTAAHWLMHSSWLKAFQSIYPRDPSASLFLVLAGAGDNGADAITLARYLWTHGQIKSVIFTIGAEREGSSFARQLHLARAVGLEVFPLKHLDTLEHFVQGHQLPFIILDGLLGVGVKLPLANDLYQLIAYLNQLGMPAVAIDIPSGIQADSGETAGNALLCQKTLPVGAPKPGLFQGDGPHCCGEVIVLPSVMAPLAAGVTTSETNLQLLELSDFSELSSQALLKASPHAHKYDNGRVLVVGGSEGLTGALVLASEAAARTGVGLVTAATWPQQEVAFLARCRNPSIMTATLPALDQQQELLEHQENWERQIHRINALVLGPGLGRTDKARAICLRLLQELRVPIILDADGLNVLKGKEDTTLLLNRVAPTLLTPHRAEFARLMDISLEQVEAAPLEWLNRAVQQWGVSILLKGPCSFFATPNNQTFVAHFPNPVLATAGTGDLLAGLLGGYWARTHAQLQRQQPASKQHQFKSSNHAYDASALAALLLHINLGQLAKGDGRGELGRSSWELLDQIYPAMVSLTQSS